MPIITAKEYIELNGAICPACGSSQIEADRLEINASITWSNVVCCECLAQWTDTYKLVGYSELTEVA